MSSPHGYRHYQNINIADSSRAHLGDVHNYGQSPDDRAFNAILESLSYPGMTDRRDALAEAHEGTFDWTFFEGGTAFLSGQYLDYAGREYKSVNHVEMNFSSWLQEDLDGLFCVIGKPGAGKSTFMKSLASSNGVQERLQSWSANETLIRAEHFFWMPGSPVQKSLEGLLRSVIYSILSTLSCLDKPNCYSSIKDLCGFRWTSMNNSSSWSRQELKRLLSGLTSIPNLSFFFLLDALDECCPQDAHWQLTKEILWMSQLPHVKLCVSFRPWDAFMQNFGSTPSLRLDLVTYHDMAKYVEERLIDAEEQCDSRHDFRKKTLSAQQLVCEVANTAQGVFLWIELVTNALCSELRKGTRSIQDLHKIVSEFPPDLDDYFHALIFNRLGKTRSNVRDTAAALKLALQINSHACSKSDLWSPKSFVNFWLLCRGRLQRGFSWKDYHSIERKPTEQMLKETVKFLEETCKDLLVPTRLVGGYWKIDFFHRTVYDFLRDNYINLGLAEHAPAHFSDPGFAMEVNRLRCICIIQSTLFCRAVSATFVEILEQYFEQSPCDRCPQWLAVCESLVITQMRATCGCEGMDHLQNQNLILGCVEARLSKYLLENIGNLPYLALLCASEDCNFGLLDVLLQKPIQPGNRNMYIPGLDVLRPVLECGCNPNRSIARWPYKKLRHSTRKHMRLKWCRRTNWEAWLGGMYLLSQQRDKKTTRSKSSLAAFTMQSCDADAIVDLLLRYGADPNCKPCITDHETLPNEDDGPTCHRSTVKELLPAIVSPEALPHLTDLLAACSNALALSTACYDQNRRAMRSFSFSEAKLEKHLATRGGQMLWNHQKRDFLKTLMDLERLDNVHVCASCSNVCGKQGHDFLLTWCIDCCGISCLCHECCEASCSGTHDFGHTRIASESYDEAETSGHTSITVSWDVLHVERYDAPPASYYTVARAVITLKEWYARNPI